MQRESLITGDLDRQPVAPAVLLTRQLLSLRPKRFIALTTKRPGCRVESLAAETNAHVRIAADVFYPLRFVVMLGEYVELPLVFNEPYFYLSRLPGGSPDCRQVEVLKFCGFAAVLHCDPIYNVEQTRLAFQIIKVSSS